MTTFAAFAIVIDIPGEFRARDLRRYFSVAVNCSQQRLRPLFAMFHFRNRLQRDKRVRQLLASIDLDLTVDSKCKCCPIAFDSVEDRDDVVSTYNNMPWTRINADGNRIELTSKCRVVPIADSDFTFSAYIESRPPAHLMPAGNVATPDKHFLDMVNKCQLPPGLIKRLELDLAFKSDVNDQVHAANIYSRVPPPEYGCDGENTDGISLTNFELGSNAEDYVRPQTELAGKWAALKRRDALGPLLTRRLAVDRASTPNDAEEWDRHMSMHEDAVSARRTLHQGTQSNMIGVSNITNHQAGTKERTFENEMEIIWDKGSSGLVFYTDAQFWAALDGHHAFEEPDDWDVDMRRYESAANDDPVIEEDEVVENDVGPKLKGLSVAARVMQRQGWRPGHGLGRRRQGIIRPVKAGDDDVNSEPTRPARAGLGFTGDAITVLDVVQPDRVASASDNSDSGPMPRYRTSARASVKRRDNDADVEDGYVVIPTAFDADKR